MAKIRCKMVLREARVESGQASIRLEAVTDGSAEERKFFAAAPYGRLELGVLNISAIEQLPVQIGGEFYVDIAPAD